MTRPTIVAANWKMNGSLTLVNEMTDALNPLSISENVEVILSPSFPYLAALKGKVANAKIHVSAQNMSEQQAGAFTGEVSSEMLKELAISHVILGHSERRTLNKETSMLVALKVKAALDAGLTPILCIGESESERESEQTEVVLASQLQPVVDEIGIEKFADVVVAYEPVWAIGTGKTASPEMAQETHAYIRKFLADLDANVAEKTPILYGGSVNAGNCKELFAQADIDGGLIGGASLKVDEFTTICQTV